MTKIETLEKQIEQLSPEELRAFRLWFAEFDAELWDEELERDVAAGKLDRLGDAAVAAHQRGEGRDILRHHATPEFWRLFDQLPETVRGQARRNFQFLKQDPGHPSLHFKQVGQFRSVSGWSSIPRAGCGSP